MYIVCEYSEEYSGHLNLKRQYVYYNSFWYVSVHTWQPDKAMEWITAGCCVGIVLWDLHIQNMENFHEEWQGDIGREETVQMEDVEVVAVGGATATSRGGIAESEGGKKLPFGLQVKEIPGVSQLVADHPGIAEAMNQLLAAFWRQMFGY